MLTLEWLCVVVCPDARPAACWLSYAHPKRRPIVPYLESLFSLRGKNALVTGAASGLGRRCAIVLAQAGARVALVDVNRPGLAKTAAMESRFESP
jgi:hypothetical protein